MAPLGPGSAPPNPDQPTEELAVPGGPAGAGSRNPASPSPPVPPSTPLVERRQQAQADYLLLASAVKQHRRSARSGGIAVTAADRRLYARLDALEQPN
jgi:hypothetical protein